MTKKFKVPKKYRNKVKFTMRLMAFALVFFFVSNMAPNFYLMKRLTAQIVADFTGESVIDDMSGVFITRKNNTTSPLMIVTDCTAWKEIFVFLALFISWPKKKKLVKALEVLAMLIGYNLIRLAILVVFPGSFDYFHPTFKYITIVIILYLWIWAIGLTKRNKLSYALGLKERKKPKKKKKVSKKPSKIKTKAKKKKRKK